MPTVQANNIEIAYEDHGDPSHPVIMLIMGFGAQLTLWPIELVDALVAQGFRVIRYDNRDVGLSQKFTGVKAPGPVKLTLLGKIGFRPKVPYSLGDMADDGAGLMDVLGIAQAHIVGGSMGGMIAQRFAERHSHKTLTLTSIFSTTGSSKVPAADKEAITALTTRPEQEDEASLVAHGVYLARTIGSPDYPAPKERLEARTRDSVRRSYYPEGGLRHMAAIIADGDRTEMLATLDVPTLVLHGEADPLVKVEGGRATAAAIPGAKLKTFAGWGHDLPMELVDEIAGAIGAHANSAS
jgi:pimeloyl-ACP methyl ester carboxylesterase